MKRIGFLLMSVMALLSCQSPKEKQIDRIKALEASDSTFNVNIMTELNTAYIDFTEKYPDDVHTPEYMLKAAQRCSVLGKPNESISLFNKIIEKYPNSNFCEEALFLKAYTYENNLNETDRAKQSYEEFIKKYPKSQLIEDAKLSLQNVGKSPEEIMKGIADTDED
jgi:outer membrane protein assembly factor BamD (BamD/ComL family)